VFFISFPECLSRSLYFAINPFGFPVYWIPLVPLPDRAGFSGAVLGVIALEAAAWLIVQLTTRKTPTMKLAFALFGGQPHQ
jgi:hypothetical protein